MCDVMSDRTRSVNRRAGSRRGLRASSQARASAASSHPARSRYGSAPVAQPTPSSVLCTGPDLGHRATVVGGDLESSTGDPVFECLHAAGNNLRETH